MTEIAHRVRTPDFPPYSQVRHLLRIWNGIRQKAVRQMMKEIWDQRGTPQDPVDWSDPDGWIGERLKGESRDLANRVWSESGKQLNPRYLKGCYLFINAYDLLKEDASGTYQLTRRGAGFLENESDVVRDIDHAEGLDELLQILSTKKRAMRADLLPEWSAFLEDTSTFGTSSTIKETLHRRLANLVERGLVDREGNVYSISNDGREYRRKLKSDGNPDPRREVNRAIARYNEAQRDRLRKRLASVDPVLFEQLVRDLLEAMGYDDVQVTKQSGDKGVDVVASVQFGITEITEVVQVKRHKASIGRPILDQLRGALPYHNAIRGTIITLGSFSKGCTEAALFTGAAPITLIDGERLMDLLVEHEVGVRKRPTPLFELDESYLSTYGSGLDEVDGNPDA